MKYRLIFLVLIWISIAYSTQYRTDPRKGSKDSTSRTDLHFRAKKVKTDSLVASDVDLKAHSFAKEIHDMYARAPIKANRENKWTLKCDPGATDIYQISDKITAEPTPITAYDFFPAEVCVYDYLNKCRTKQHMSVASNISSICNFKLKDMIISSKGTIMESNSFEEIYFGDTTMVGGKAPEYAPVMAYMYLKGFEVGHAEFFEKRAISRTISTLVVPLRSRFDDCFNHQSFQTLPLIGLIFEFHSDIFHSVSWHASRHTAALLMLLNITSDKIIIEESIRTEQILLPWIPYWNPIQLSPIYGISRRVCSEMTQGLLRKSFPKTLLESIHPIKVMNYKYEVLPEDQLLASAKHRRFIVYLHRSEGKRHVLNEPDILQAIHHSLHPDYQLIVLSSTRAYDEIEKMHVVWQQYAKIIVRAKVLIGPHGGGVNNLIWAPDDCELIEFNEFPDDDSYAHSHNQVPVRTPFLAGWWAKGGRKYWTIAPSMKSPINFYEHPMKVSTREVLEVLSLIDNGKLLLQNNSLQSYPFDPHSCFPNQMRTKWSKC